MKQVPPHDCTKYDRPRTTVTHYGRMLIAARDFERAVKAYSAWNTRPLDEYERGKYDAMRKLFDVLATQESQADVVIVPLNAYDDMRDALEAARERLREPEASGENAPLWTREVLNKMTAALAKAGEGKE